MAEEKNNSVENTLDDVDKVFAVSGIALSGLSLLFYPTEEIADATDTKLGFVGTVAKVVSGLGLIGTLWSIGLLYHRQVQIPTVLKWILIPLLVLDALVLSLLFAMIAINTGSIGKVGKLASKYIKPAVCSLGAAGLIVAMAIMPKRLLKMSFIGLVIHYLPAAFSYANKNPYYVLVIAVRTGGLITALAGDVIDVATNDSNEQKQLES